MPKIWKNNRRDISDLKQRLRKGSVVYTVRRVSGRVAPYEDSKLYAEHVFDWRSPITGNLMTGHLSIEGLLAQENEIHEQPPRGMRNIADPAPQVAGPLGHGTYDGGVLDDAELSHLEKLTRGASHPTTRQPIRGRGRRR
jgi:hypothetical protein